MVRLAPFLDSWRSRGSSADISGVLLAVRSRWFVILGFGGLYNGLSLDFEWFARIQQA